MFWHASKCIVNNDKVNSIMIYIILTLFFMYWAFPIQTCALVVYYFIIKKRIGRFLNPYVKHDMLVPIIVVVVWSMVGLYFSRESKSMANGLELFWLGGLWTAIICIRFLVICITKKKNKTFCFLGNVIVLILAVLSAIFFSSLPE